MSSRVKEKAARKREQPGTAAGVSTAPAPWSVLAGIACLAAFIGSRGPDLKVMWGTGYFLGTLATVAIPALFLVGLARGDRLAAVAARFIGGVLAVALVAAPSFGYPAPRLHLFVPAAALAAMVVLLSLPSARAWFDRR